MKTFYKLTLAVLLLTAQAVRAQVPVLSSLSSAPATIYLDFDGHYVNGTSWNMNGPITCGPSNLTAAQMSEIYNRVAEDYRPFNVNVTTDSTKYWAAPYNQRIRIVFTITSDWYGPAGGVSYMGSFTWGDNTPGFVFTQLLNYNTKNIAEAGSHEAGHTLGLRHQSSYDANCVKTAEYNSGTGSGDIGWAPIMGVGYYRNFTLWNNGANPYGCSQFQNDLDIITTYNGFTYRTDDYSGSTNGQTTTVNFTNNQFSVSGIIERNTDIDCFKFTMPVNGNFALDALPFSVASGSSGANLDIQVELLNKNGSVLGTYNPGTLLYASIDTALSSGVYYLRVRGRGNSNTSEYASLGSYNLQARITVGGGSTLAARKLELQGTSDTRNHRLNWVVEADEAIGRQVLEVSVNGTTYQPIAQVNNDARSYMYQPSKGAALYYRVNVLFSNGQQQYSNTVMLRNQAYQMPSLAGNMLQNRAVVNSPGTYDYSITDLNGRTMKQGKVMQGVNVLDIDGFGSGMYLIQYRSGADLLTEKFMKQ